LWGLPNTAVGLAAAIPSYVAGKVAGTHPYFTFGDDALQLHNSPLMKKDSGVTLGNVQMYAPGVEPDDVIPQIYTGLDGRVGDHEGWHSRQSEKWGPLFLPKWVAGGMVSPNNPLEIEADQHAAELLRRRTGGH
jgi:hypothetical protein